VRPGGTLIYLLKTVFVEGQDRFADLFPQYPPAYIYQSASRVPWRAVTNGNRSNTVAYAVYIWKKTQTHQDTKFRWFDWQRQPAPVFLAGGRFYEFDEAQRYWRPE